ncbi:MAG: NAD(P)H-hydrate dehydratase [Candidatus Omnitrophica bacterium]|nr:NAD(P)H-hydrate dehydratase [Candidatus Omnitrophota bacterium]
MLYRRQTSHKGDFGHIFVLGGCGRYSGAGILSATAALRSGSGLVTLGVCKSLTNALIKIKPPEIMLLPLADTRKLTFSFSAYPVIKKALDKVDVLLIGPGLSQEKSTAHLIRTIIKNISLPMIIDADGLNALKGHLDKLKAKSERRKTEAKSERRKDMVITPHPGEMARLLGKSIGEVQSKRKEVAKKFARDYKITVVLKGYHTVVADDKGNLYINKTGNPGMATAGSGDVLSGIISAFLGQGLDGFAAAKYAVYLHGLAGDSAAKKKTQLGMLASDIIEEIPKAIKISSYSSARRKAQSAKLKLKT